MEHSDGEPVCRRGYRAIARLLPKPPTDIIPRTPGANTGGAQIAKLAPHVKNRPGRANSLGDTQRNACTTLPPAGRDNRAARRA